MLIITTLLFFFLEMNAQADDSGAFDSLPKASATASEFHRAQAHAFSDFYDKLKASVLDDPAFKVAPSTGAMLARKTFANSNKAQNAMILERFTGPQIRTAASASRDAHLTNRSPESKSRASSIGPTSGEITSGGVTRIRSFFEIHEDEDE